MTFRAWALAGTASILALSSIVSARAQVPDPQASESQPTTGPTSVFLPPANPVPPLDDRAREALRRAVKNDQRIDTQRDRWRNPEATLQFFGVRPSDTVVEIWPGQGWYTSILGPYLKQGDGKLIVGHFDAVASNSQVVRQMVDAYRARFATDTGVYGNVNVVPFGPRSMPMAPPNSVDKVLTFRNIHNWMAQGWTEKAFADFYTVLKPGGILGIEEHRGRTDEPQDPLARDGYVREDYVIQLAREAGFEFIGGAEINANPADTKDHPFGVWTLPPVSRTSPIGEIDDPGFDRRRYDDIGESDRMTLRFRKPLDATGVGLASSRPTADQIPVTIIPAPPPPPRRGRRSPTPPPPPPPIVAGVEVKPDEAGAAPVVDPKEGTAVIPASGLRPATEEPQTKAPPPPAPPPPATGRRGSSTKGQTPPPAPATAPSPTPEDAATAKPAGDAVPKPSAPDTKPKATTEPAATATPTPLRSRQRGTATVTPKAPEPTDTATTTTPKPKSGRTSARDAEATPAASSATRSRTRSGTTAAPAEPAKTKSGRAASREKAAEEAPTTTSRRSSRRPAAEPVQAKKPASKAKASDTESTRATPSGNRNRSETKAEPKKKVSSTATPSSRTKAAPKPAPTKKSPPPAKANSNKPDWVVPPKKKN
jgi:predicted methyltransferase